MKSRVSHPVRPTNVRWRVMTLLVLVSALTFLDRLNLSIAGKFIQDEFHFGTQQMGWILSAFVLGYALFQVPGGWLGDRYGPRRVVTGAILAWSIFSAATALAPLLPQGRWLSMAWAFALVRFMVGLGEGAAFPNSNKIVSLWMGTKHRAIGSSMFLAGIGVGGTAAPIFIVWIMKVWGWQTSFYVCGCLGLIVALVWHLYVTDYPEAHSGVNSAELAMIPGRTHSADCGTEPGTHESIPLVALLRNSSVVGLIVSFFFVGYASYLYYTWFYLYIVQVRHLTIMQGGVWGSTPFLAMAIMTPIGGWLSDLAVARLGRRRGRQAVVWFGLGFASFFLLLGSHVASNTVAIVLMAIAAGFLGFANTGWWATCIDLSPNHAGTLSGVMNMSGNLGGWVSPILTAYFASRFGWTQALDFAALLTLLAGALWFLVRADQRLELSC